MDADHLDESAVPPDFIDKLATLDQRPITITGTRGRAILLMLACLAFVVLSILAIAKGEVEGVSAGGPALLIFGLGLAIAIAQIARPPVMTIAWDGIGVKTLFRTWRLRWDEVRGFSVLKGRPNAQAFGAAVADMAAFTRVHPPRSIFAQRRATGADGGFGPGWPLAPSELAALLNAARARVLTAGREKIL